MRLTDPTRRRFMASAAGAGLAAVVWPHSSGAADAKTDLDPKALQALLDKAYDFLKSRQRDDGSFGDPQAGEPGLTALVAAALIRAGRDSSDPVVAKALKYLETMVKPDGGVYNKGLANYTTSLAIMTFKEANAGGKYDKVIAAATKFLRSLQYGEADEVSDKDAKFGGAGYDKKGSRGGPDMSNTHFFVEALIAGGASRDDPAIKKALSFLSRSQNLPGEFNDQEYAKKVEADDKGGFVYNPLAAGDLKNQKRTPTGGLRSEGGMTYAGLKSFLYAGVAKDDPRVKAAVDWVRRHYTLAENPGMGRDGLFYYYHVFAKAMDALGEDRFADAKGVKHDWRKELFEALREKQKPDGSWVNEKSRAYLENMPELATAFAVLALSYCKG
jgi:squalene-hopene/tetraprenyl-beta-curcumene cyclase